MTDKNTTATTLKNLRMWISEDPSKRIVLLILLTITMILSLTMLIMFFDLEMQRLIISVFAGLLQVGYSGRTKAKKSRKKGGRHV